MLSRTASSHQSNQLQCPYTCSSQILNSLCPCPHPCHRLHGIPPDLTKLRQALRLQWLLPRIHPSLQLRMLSGSVPVTRIVRVSGLENQRVEFILA
jgi:hypothetical protein